MSFLWGGAIKKKQLTMKKKPSPTCQKHFPDSARKPEIILKECYKQPPFVLSRPIKRISLFTSFFKAADAGMTVEASIVLPLFLFFFLNLGCAIELIRLHGNLQLALWQIGSKLSVYGYAVDSGEQPQGGEDGDEWWRGLAGIGFSSTFIKNEIARSAGKGYLNQSPLTNGANGLQFWESRLFGPEDEISIVVTYSVSPWSSMVGFGNFRMANRYYSHIWNGYQLPGGGEDESPEEKQIVYVTETGSAYHPRRDCSYLTLSVKYIPIPAIEWERNMGGGKYYPCGICVRGGTPAIYYITNYGSSYHYDRHCAGLKRTVVSMELGRAVEEGYRPCSRCGH